MRAVVPAYNEEMTVSAVVDALLRSNVFEEIVVVDDGSKDATYEVAREAGARVVRTPRNLGKGGAMIHAVNTCCENDDHVAFFDADLVGLRPDHARYMQEIADQGYDMVCAMRDKGPVQNVLQVTFSPMITGERILARWLIDALPDTCWSGYSIETAMNDVCTRRGGRAAHIFLDGVAMRTKSEKTGLVNGVRDHLKMARQIFRTRRALARSGGFSCR